MAAPTPPHGVPDGPGAAPVPPELAKLLRDQLEAVADEVEEEVRRQVPEYARPADGTYLAHLRSGVVQALTLFVDHIADPRGQGAAITATYYELGRGEALEGRALDALQSALRVGGLHAWRLMGRTAEALGLDSSVVAALGELAFQTVHEVAEAAAAGYAEAQLRSTDELERRRRRLLDLLLGEGPVAPEAVRDLAHGARWSVPRQVAVVALAATPDQREADRPLAAAGALVDMESRPPRMLVPDPDGSGRFGGRAFTLALRGRPAAIGPTVPLAEAARSLRWATRALGLMGRGILPRQGWCAAPTISPRCCCTATNRCSTSSGCGSWPRWTRSRRGRAAGSPRPCWHGCSAAATCPMSPPASTSTHRRSATACASWRSSSATPCTTRAPAWTSSSPCARRRCGTTTHSPHKEPHKETDSPLRKKKIDY